MPSRSETLSAESCPVARAAEVIGRKWVLLILRDLAEGPRRFSALQNSLAINPRTLSQRLSMLQAEGIVKRTWFAEVPPRAEYQLTAKGAALIPIIDAIRAYGDHWL
jgi:DNA-binding HxlR family transcriptional regulator